MADANQVTDPSLGYHQGPGRFPVHGQMAVTVRACHRQVCHPLVQDFQQILRALQDSCDDALPARLALVKSVSIVVKESLRLLGVKAPMRCSPHLLEN